MKEQPFQTEGTGTRGGPETVDGPEAGGTQETEGGAGWYLPAGVATAVLFLAVAAGLTPPFAPVRRKLRNAARASRGTR